MRISAWTKIPSMTGLPKGEKLFLDSGDQATLGEIKSALCSGNSAAMLASSMIGRAATVSPYLVFPKVASMCTTSTARLALTGLYIGVQLVVIPAARFFQQYTEQRFVAKEMIKCRESWADAAKNKASLWKNAELAQSCQQQLVSDARPQAIAMVSFIRSLAESAISLALSYYSIGALGAISGLSVGLFGLTMLAPPVMSAITLRYKVRAGVDAVDAQKSLDGVLQGFWDNNTIGDATRRENWLDLLRQTSIKSAAADTRNIITTNWCQFFDLLPRTIISTLIDLSNFQIFYLPDQAPLFPQDTLRSYYTIQSLSMSLGSIISIASSYMHLKQTMMVRDTIKARLGFCSELKNQITIPAFKLQKDGALRSAAQVFSSPDTLRGSGFWTLKGPNGAGKTTYLTYCRDKLGDCALFLPAEHNLQFNIPKASSGQTMINTLNRIDSDPNKPQVILLDEWNAHLSPENEKLMEKMLRRWSKEISVVQVTHRLGEPTPSKIESRGRGPSRLRGFKIRKLK